MREVGYPIQLDCVSIHLSTEISALLKTRSHLDKVLMLQVGTSNRTEFSPTAFKSFSSLNIAHVGYPSRRSSPDLANEFSQLKSRFLQFRLFLLLNSSNSLLNLPLLPSSSVLCVFLFSATSRYPISSCPSSIGASEPLRGRYDSDRPLWHLQHLHARPAHR